MMDKEKELYRMVNDARTLVRNALYRLNHKDFLGKRRATVGTLKDVSDLMQTVLDELGGIHHED